MTGSLLTKAMMSVPTMVSGCVWGAGYDTILAQIRERTNTSKPSISSVQMLTISAAMIRVHTPQKCSMQCCGLLKAGQNRKSAPKIQAAENGDVT